MFRPEIWAAIQSNSFNLILMLVANTRRSGSCSGFVGMFWHVCVRSSAGGLLVSLRRILMQGTWAASLTGAIIMSS